MANYFFLVVAAVAAAPVALTAALVAAATLASAISATCFAALFILSKAELAAAIADFTAATATSEPAGAEFAAVSKRLLTVFGIRQTDFLPFWTILLEFVQ